MHEASADEVKLGSYRLAVGATLPVVYAPNNPADVRASMSWEGLQVPPGSVCCRDRLPRARVPAKNWRPRRPEV